MQTIDDFLNDITMYRLVVYGLAILSGLGIALSVVGRLSATPVQMLVSLAILLATGYVTDRGLGRLFNTPTNTETWLITGLILFLIVQPADSIVSGLALFVAAGLSNVSKFVFAWHGKHIFNPAALAAAVLSLTGLSAVTWWVGSSLFWPFTLVIGLAIVRKIRRFPLFLTFAVVSIFVQLVLFVHLDQPLVHGMKSALLASPFLFLGTIMLTEPATMPPRRNLQIVFAALVALLYVTAWHLGPLIIYPEVALLIGNIFAFIVSPKFRIRLRLTSIQQISDRVYNYVFMPDRQFSFMPGQYMELTLADVPYDSRGNRRTFTLASSPTEAEVQIGMKYHEPASMWKSTFSRLRLGDVVYASQLAGNFTIQGHERQKLVFVAGGIGITPFRSMIKYLTDTSTKVDIVLLYTVPTANEFAYVREFKQSAAIGVRSVPIVTRADAPLEGVETGRLDAAMLTRLVPDYAKRTFYISGPNAMVDGTKHMLRSLGLKRAQIKTDHFSGY